MRKFGVMKDLTANELEKLYAPVRLQGDGWYIEVFPNADMTALEVRCSGLAGDSDMLIIKPSYANMVHVTSSAAQREVL